jgi:hypothetical protein
MGNPIRLGLLTGAATLCALTMAAPAAAQYRAPYPGRYYQDRGMDAQIGQLRLRVDAEFRRGMISRGEAAALRARLDEMTRLQRLYYRNGLNSAERADLDRRLRDFRLALRDSADRGGGYGRGDYDRDRDYDRDDDRDRDDDYDRDDDDRRGDAYGRGDVDDDDGDDARIDRNRDGWDDRDRDRDGRWDDDVASGVAATGMLRVGQRATSNLGGVPYEYRDRYRDGGGVYYRSDGRAIYQIDARTNAIIRVYAIGR